MEEKDSPLGRVSFGPTTHWEDMEIGLRISG